MILMIMANVRNPPHLTPSGVESTEPAVLGNVSTDIFRPKEIEDANGVVQTGS